MVQKSLWHLRVRFIANNTSKSLWIHRQFKIIHIMQLMRPNVVRDIRGPVGMILWALVALCVYMLWYKTDQVDEPVITPHSEWSSGRFLAGSGTDPFADVSEIHPRRFGPHVPPAVRRVNQLVSSGVCERFDSKRQQNKKNNPETNTLCLITALQTC